MSDELLRELIAGQKQQTELFRRYLWRLRFSLLSLLLVTTATAIGLGIMAYKQQQPANTAVPQPAGAWTTFSGPPIQPYSAPAQNYDASLPKPK